MKIVIDIGEFDSFLDVQGNFERYRRKLVRLQRAVKTDRGHGKLVVNCWVTLYDRKKPWKHNPKVTLAHRNDVRRLKRLAVQPTGEVVN